MDRILRLLVIMLLPLYMAGSASPAFSFPFWPSNKLNYKVHFQGVGDKKLESALKEHTVLATADEAKILTPLLIRRRAEDKLPDLLSALHAMGYYDAVIRFTINDRTKPIEVNYSINLGTPYSIKKEEIALLTPSSKSIHLPNINKPQALTGKRAEAAALQAKAKDIEQFVAAHNCFLSVEVMPSLLLHREHKDADAFYETKTGKEANFGRLIIKGNHTVSEDYIRHFIPWKEGECFHASQLTKAQGDLLKSQLFSLVEMQHASSPDKNGKVPVTLQVTEALHRTVKAGVSYMTDEGAGASAGWEHRNLFGSGEKLEARGVVSTLEYSAEPHYTEPFFLRNDQSLQLSGRLARENPDPYTSSNTSITAVIERKLIDPFRIGVGTGYRLSEVTDIYGRETYGLISLPLYAAWDNRDNVLNPKKGFLARIEGAPYMDTLSTGAGFFRMLLNASTYIALPGSYEPVIATRGAIGSITGASTHGVPADLRFYAGGGSSVRGFGFQELSPQMGGEPLGGRSLLELSSEFRFRVTDTWGGAAFIDGGTAFDSEYPDFDNGLRFGAGIGVRYYSGFGPLRLDLAVPLNKRQRDKKFQLYVSLGQAF